MSKIAEAEVKGEKFLLFGKSFISSNFQRQWTIKGEPRIFFFGFSYLSWIACEPVFPCLYPKLANRWSFISP